MKIFQFLALIVFISFTACEPTSTTSTNTQSQQTEENSPNNTARVAPNKTHQDSLDENLIHDCKILGTVLENNQIWLRSSNTLVAIVADSTTYEEDYGDSHRVLVSYDTKTCKLTSREVLPVNFSPDYPYYLATINYSNASQIIGIRGLSTVYIYNTQTKKLDAISPKYLSPRLADDAQSGSIQHLEVWENYMVGFAEDKGVFAIDINNKQAPEPLSAYAEYKLPNSSFSTLFMLTSEGDKQQIILPTYNIEEDSFAINPMFQQPKDMNTQISKGVRNNRFIILRENGETPTATVVDMLKQQKIELPDNMKNQPTKEILAWLKANTK